MEKKIVVITVLLFIIGTFHASGITYSMSPQEAADIVINNILQSNKDDYLIYIWGPISSGIDVFGTKEFIFTTPEDGYVFYIDLYPTANLYHPVKYVFVYESTGDFFVIDAISHPINYEDYQIIPTAIGNMLYSVENRRASIPDRDYQFKDSSRQTKWAVLMNGGGSQFSNHVRYWNDLSNIYITLNSVYDYADENIIVLCSDGLDPAPDQSNGLNSDPDLDGDGDDDIMYSCVLSNVDLVFSNLANDLNPGDKLYVFTTDHGSSVSGWDTLFNLWNGEELFDYHFASLLDALPECEIICTFEPCFSGGFLDDVVVPPGPVVASSACRHDEYSYAMSNLEYDEYVFHWTAAVKGEDAYGNPVDADYNQDGIITMDEAHEYALINDAQPENPQYDDYPEDIGSTISLLISNLAPEIPQKPNGPKDGVVGKMYTYSTTTFDIEGDNIYYMWDWGDGNFSDWLGPYISNETAKSTHNWVEEGNYEIKVKAKDELGSETQWSDFLMINILSKPFLEIGNISGGFRITAEIFNSGIDAIGVDTIIRVDGDLLILGNEKISKSPIIRTNDWIVISSNFILGFGDINITVEASIDDSYASKTVDGYLFLFYVIITK